MRLTIASRRSELARIQAYQVGDALLQAHPQLEIKYSFHESLGDRNQNDPLWQMPEKGVFTQDFREGLLRGDFDLVVHSWKDLAIEFDPETEIVATLPRAKIRCFNPSSRYWRRNTRSRYLAWNAVIDGSMPWPVTSPMTAATRFGATRNTS